MNSVDTKNLQQLKNLAGFSATHLKKLADKLSVETAAKNEIVFDQGDDAKLVYLLLSGVAKLSYLGDHEREAIVSLLPAGRFFGLDSIIPQSHYACRCEAFEDCTIGSITPKILIELFSVTSYEAFLKGYVAVFHPSGISIALNLSHELLANLVGASRQQVTEYLNEFDHDRIIFRDGRCIIIDPEKLQKILTVMA